MREEGEGEREGEEEREREAQGPSILCGRPWVHTQHHKKGGAGTVTC